MVTRDPEATAAAVERDGWMHAGDMASVRPDGPWCSSAKSC